MDKQAKKAFIDQLYALFQAKEAFTCIEQFAAMAESLMADQHVRFEGDEQREWFYESIIKNSRDPRRNFIASAFVAMSFKEFGVPVIG